MVIANPRQHLPCRASARCRENGQLQLLHTRYSCRLSDMEKGYEIAICQSESHVSNPDFFASETGEKARFGNIPMLREQR
ncbi:hypothetical protein TNIN_180841 [Trichonephila inaurata madagascariensis]|uniref:Uncharacterized protein n=1 Tax=Trichonephila inaurata madagascariensis TaxID=2747483 RepID=A0A8X6MH27_9ARAC|nr:hypothetical protein TNIN_180841 [Trichonephila inaurata madagascariensis]